MRNKKRCILVAVLSAALILSLLPSNVLGWDKLYPPRRVNLYTSWSSTNDWLYAQAWADIVGERRCSSVDEWSTVETHQASTFAWTYSESRRTWWGMAISSPASREHKINVQNWFNSYYPTPSIPTLMYLRGYDNSVATQPPSPELLYALDTLWNFIMDMLHLPLPSPKGLIWRDTPAITVSYDSDWRGGHIHFNNDPSLQGADWLWYINKPVNTGYYYFEEYVTGEAGIYTSTPWGSSFATEDDVCIYFFWYVGVYRS